MPLFATHDLSDLVHNEPELTTMIAVYVHPYNIVMNILKDPDLANICLCKKVQCNWCVCVKLITLVKKLQYLAIKQKVNNYML